MRRREFITVLGGAAGAWPVAARAQQQTAMPVVGYLNGLSAAARPDLVEGFRRGLREMGYVAGQTVAIESRFADNQPDRLPALAGDLIARRVAVIAATGGNNTALAAKALTATIPIVFTSGTDPVVAGLVTSLNRPEANVTGVSWFNVDLGPKLLDLVRELAPGAAVAVIVNPKNPESLVYEQAIREAAVRLAGLKVEVFKATTASEIDATFEAIVKMKAGLLVVGSDPFFAARAVQLVVLAARNNLPVVSTVRTFTAAGGLMSYGNDTVDAYWRAGVYVGRILKGAKPADLPVDRAVKFELVINLQTAKTLKRDIPDKLLALADEVLE
jgi:putative tryptophan/tyrosine transport system substrate-binding protein